MSFTDKVESDAARKRFKATVQGPARRSGRQRNHSPLDFFCKPISMNKTIRSHLVTVVLLVSFTQFAVPIVWGQQQQPQRERRATPATSPTPSPVPSPIPAASPSASPLASPSASPTPASKTTN